MVQSLLWTMLALPKHVTTCNNKIYIQVCITNAMLSSLSIVQCIKHSLSHLCGKVSVLILAQHIALICKLKAEAHVVM